MAGKRNVLGLLAQLAALGATTHNQAEGRRRSPASTSKPRTKRDPLQNRANRIARRASTSSNPRAWRL